VVKTFLAVSEFPVLKCNEVRDAASLGRCRHGLLTVLARFLRSIQAGGMFGEACDFRRKYQTLPLNLSRAVMRVTVGSTSRW
jgi:hypothetical protein